MNNHPINVNPNRIRPTRPYGWEPDAPLVPLVPPAGYCEATGAVVSQRRDGWYAAITWAAPGKPDRIEHYGRFRRLDDANTAARQTQEHYHA